MLIRAFRQADLPTARELLRQLGYEIGGVELSRRLARALAAPDHRIVIAEHDGRVAGLMHVFVRPALEKPCEAVVQALVVDEAMRGRGIGQALMRDAEAWAAARGLASVALHTRNARAFYASLGYATVASPDFMRKHLDAASREEEGP
jgi:N-acetylglutamate synthase-like GNAT family acetyltransferase